MYCVLNTGSPLLEVSLYCLCDVHNYHCILCCRNKVIDVVLKSSVTCTECSGA